MLTLTDQAVELSFISAGQFIAQDRWVHPERVIDSFELIYITQGPVHLAEDGSLPFTAQSGELLLLRPQRRHRGTDSSPAGTAFYWVHFDLSDPGFLGSTGPQLVSGETAALAPLFRQLLNYANSPFYPAYTRDLALGLILAEVNQTKPEPGRHSALLNRCLEWVRINSDRRLTVEAVAQQFSYHPDYLSRLLRRYTGLPLKQYLDQRHLEYVKARLLNGNESVKELAAALGYTNENQFNHYFNYHEGLTPVQYRERFTRTHLNKA